jgi:hypothetical protein
LKPITKRSDKSQRRERWPEELEIEREVIEPEEVKENPEAFRWGEFHVGELAIPVNRY